METVLDRIEKLVAEDPDRLLYTFLNSRGVEVARLTRAQCLARVLTLAAQLSEAHGLRPGDRVLLAYLPSLEMICAFFACARVGIIPVPVAAPTAHGLEAALYNMEFVAKDCGARAILSTCATTNLVESHTTVSGIDLKGANYIASMAWVATDQIAASNTPPLKRPQSSILFLQYTSGSTSAPKGVMVTHQNIIANARQVVDHPDPIGVCWLPQHHDMGLIGYYINCALVGGMLHCFSPTSFIQRPSLWLETITKYRATVTSAPSFAFEYCLRPGRVSTARCGAIDLSSLKFLMAAAEPMKPDVYHDFLRTFAPFGLKPKAFVVAYGLAENTLAVSSHGRSALLINRRDLAQRRMRGALTEAEVLAAQPIMSCGRPLGDTHLLIVDPERRVALKDGTVGEIWLNGTSKCAGYWGDPVATESIFRARLANADVTRGSENFLRTGDMGFLHENELYVCGRWKDMIILRGQNYYPQDIEAVVEGSSAAIRVGCVAAFELDENADRGVVVVAELAASRAIPDGMAILAAVRTYLNIEVKRIVFTSSNSLPKTSSGKLMRFEARRMLAEGCFNVLGEAKAHSQAGVAGANRGIERKGPFPSLQSRYNLRGDESFTIAAAGVDSLDLVILHHELSEMLSACGLSELVEAVDIRFIQMLTIRELFEFASLMEDDTETTVAQIRLLIRVKRDAARESERALMSADNRLTFNPPPRLHEPPSGVPRSVLLTGATGFIGPFLLMGLLQQTNAVIYALVRAPTAAEGKQRLWQGLLAVGYGARQQRDFENRVVPVTGNLEQNKLGLLPKVWATLVREVDTIYHNGALVNYVFPYHRMRAANVLGTHEILRLAFEDRFKILNYISTTFIFGWATKNVLYEDDTNPEMEWLDFGYSQSKWVAEQLVLKARARGLATRIFRPSLVTPSVSGGGIGFDITLRLLSFMIRHGLSVNTVNQVSFTPVDITANNIVAISMQPATVNNIFHITRDLYTNMPEVCAIITRLTGKKFQLVSLPEFVPEVTRRCSSSDPLNPLKNFLVTSADNISAMEFKRYNNFRYRTARAISSGALPDPPLESTILGILRFIGRNALCPLTITPHVSLTNNKITPRQS